jgi:hypothetical protein
MRKSHTMVERSQGQAGFAYEAHSIPLFPIAENPLFQWKSVKAAIMTSSVDVAYLQHAAGGEGEIVGASPEGFFSARLSG